MIIKTIQAVTKALIIGFIFSFTVQPVYADVDITYVVGASGSYGCTFGPNIPTCPAGFDTIFQNPTQTLCTANNVVSSKRIAGLNSCPINLSDIPNPRQSDRFTELANICEAHRIANGATFLFNQPSPGGATAITSCNVVNVAGVWEDIRVVTACNADCVQTVEQRNSVSGETRIIERACDAGQGQCLIVTPPVITQVNDSGVDLITDNPSINVGTYEFSTAQATQTLCARLLATDANLLSAKTVDLRDRCRDLTLESNDLLQLRGVQNLSAEELVSRATVSKQQYQTQLSNVNSRLAAIRPALFNASKNIAHQSVQKPTQTPTQQRDDSLQPEASLLAQTNNGRQIGGGAGDDVSRLGVFFTGTRSDGATEASLLATEYSYDSKSYTFGADYLLNQSTILGAAIGYGSSDTDIDVDAGRLSSDSLALSFYGTHYLGQNWFVDGVVGYGQTDYKNIRSIRYVANTVEVNQLATSSSDSSQWFLSLGFGKSINQKIDVDLSARFNYLLVDIDRFSETVSDSVVGSGLALEIDEQTLESITSDISIRLSKPYGVAYGVLVPFVGLNWFHEFNDDSDALRVRFLNDPFSVDFNQSGFDDTFSTIFEIPLDSVDINYGRVNVGMNLLLSDGWNFYLTVGKYLNLRNSRQTDYAVGLRKAL